MGRFAGAVRLARGLGGVDASSHVRFAYSGATIAPYSDMFSNELRLRAATGYGQYS